jgi:hypothetical protein
MPPKKTSEYDIYKNLSGICETYSRDVPDEQNRLVAVTEVRVTVFCSKGANHTKEDVQEFIKELTDAGYDASPSPNNPPGLPKHGEEGEWSQRGFSLKRDR